MISRHEFNSNKYMNSFILNTLLYSYYYRQLKLETRIISLVTIENKQNAQNKFVGESLTFIIRSSTLMQLEVFLSYLVSSAIK